MRSLLQIGPPGASNIFTIVAVNDGSKRGGGGFSLGPVAWISGICLLVAVAICLIAAACLLRRKDRRHVAALAAQQEAQIAAATAAAAQEAAYRAAHPPTIPVVIVNPDGEVELAERLEMSSASPKGELASPKLVAGGSMKGAEPPIGFRTPQV